MAVPQFYTYLDQICHVSSWESFPTQCLSANRSLKIYSFQGVKTQKDMNLFENFFLFYFIVSNRQTFPLHLVAQTEVFWSLFYVVIPKDWPYWLFLSDWDVSFKEGSWAGSCFLFQKAKGTKLVMKATEGGETSWWVQLCASLGFLLSTSSRGGQSAIIRFGMPPERPLLE